MNENRGSLWKKWDLHIHTPYSLLNNNYGNPLEEATWEKFISDLEHLPPEFKAIGINDYIFIDGYKKVLEYKRKGRLSNLELILPVIELRLKKFTGHERLRKINFHIIFSNEIEEIVLEQQFLSQLYGKFKLSPLLDGYPIQWRGAITRESLPQLGASIRETVPQNRLADYNESDLVLGFNNITFEEDEIRQILEKSIFLEHKFLTAIGKTEWDSFNWHEGGIADKKSVINNVDFVFISAENLAKFKAAKKRLKDDGVNHFLLDCSDAHNFSDNAEKDHIGKCFTWIKADTTFEGLKQLTNQQGKYRVFVGDEPEIFYKVKSNKTKYINSVFINKKQDSVLNETWFTDIRIDLNHELIAIIGNKGNGKSALSDIIGLLGNSRNYKEFSFLNPNKFTDPKDNKANSFIGKLIWESGEPDEKILDENHIDYAFEKVRYIPQLFLENICNYEEAFEKELKEVIFSHVPEDERFFLENLDELIDYKSSIIDQDLESLYSELSLVNESIIRLEDMGIKQNLQRLQGKLIHKKKELESHEKNKPDIVTEPQGDQEIDRQKQISAFISGKKTEKAALEQTIAAYNVEKAKIKSTLQTVERILGLLSNFRSQFIGFDNNIKDDLFSLGLHLGDIIKIEIDSKKVEAIRKTNKERLAIIENDVNHMGAYNEETEQFSDNTSTKLRKIIAKIEELNAQLNEPYRKYQVYQSRLKEWDKKKKAIEGDSQKEDTIEFYKSQIDYISSKLPDELTAKYEERMLKVRAIFNKKIELLNVYKALYKPVENFIAQYPLANENYQVKFGASLEAKNFIDDFFKYIHQGVRGSFYGLKEGKEKLNTILTGTDFNNIESFVSFLKVIIKHLSYDQREKTDAKERQDVRSQLKDDVGDQDRLLFFYNFLFSCEYLNPIYQLKLGDRSLRHLSPGEKGALLLIFYLIIDKNDIPLIIDQPEENLDNQSVFELLVPFIKEAKKRRQVIIVTHNPNLAVVCDAEQIICARIEKAGNFKVSYTTGAIENPVINKRITEVLEGTLPAFDIRDHNYRITRASGT